VPDALDTVKAHVDSLRRYAETKDDAAALIQRQRADALEAVVRELEDARKRLLPIPSDYGDLSDLPAEVIAQLNLTRIDELEQQMRDIVAAADGEEIGLDRIIIELYRRYRYVGERRFIMNKLYRMAQKGLINSVEGKKGVYYLPKPWATKSNSSWGDDLDDDIPF